MTDLELQEQCKMGLNIPSANTSFDGMVMQKLLAVKSFMRRGGVSETLLNDPAAVGAIVVGVTDIWSLTGGEIKFSPVFHILTNQLAIGSLPSEG